MPGNGTHEAPVVAIFDLDGTITRSDTFVRFLLACLARSPARILPCCWLPLAIVMFYLRMRSNTWLKVTFLRAIAGRSHRTDVDAIARGLVPKLMRRAVRAKAVATIDAHRKRGHRLVLATASLDVYVGHLAGALGFDSVVCTRVAWDDQDRLTGELDGGNCYGEQKRLAVARLLGDRSGLRLISYSDNGSDMPLLEWSDSAVVVNASSSLQRQARARGFDIRVW